VAKVVIIEDEPDQVELYRMLLETAGHVVVGAGAWLNQVQPPKGVAPDVIILDERLHGRSGTSLIPRIRKKFPRAAILLLTADPDKVDQAVGLGADLGRQKPIRGADLLSCVQRMLGSP
jgi:two-component system, OmpR family, response regulator VicR